MASQSSDEVAKLREWHVDESGGSTKSNAPPSPPQRAPSKASAKVAPINVVKNDVHSNSMYTKLEKEIETIAEEVVEMSISCGGDVEDVDLAKRLL